MSPHRADAVLPALPDDEVRRVLCVVAHPDDMEYGASAAVHHWTSRGIEVSYLLLTSGEAGMDEAPEVIGPVRAREQRAACTVVGVEDLRILAHPDGMLEQGLPLRRDIARTIREVRPDLVLTTTFEVEAYGGLNQADPITAPRASPPPMPCAMRTIRGSSASSVMTDTGPGTPGPCSSSAILDPRMPSRWIRWTSRRPCALCAATRRTWPT
jgi:hypothetical protein